MPIVNLLTELTALAAQDRDRTSTAKATAEANRVAGFVLMDGSRDPFVIR
jgi:hypothetical protein